MKLKYLGTMLTDNYPPFEIPYFQDMVAAGFPSPASDFMENPIDLNQYLVKNGVATFLFRVSGTSMIEALIDDGSLLLVDCSMQAIHNSIVVAKIHGDLVCRRLCLRPKYCLIAENKEYQPIYLNPDMEFEIMGVVTAVIHQFA